MLLNAQSWTIWRPHMAALIDLDIIKNTQLLGLFWQQKLEYFAVRQGHGQMQVSNIVDLITPIMNLIIHAEGQRRMPGARQVGGAEEDRTPDLRIANATLSHLSYGPNHGNAPAASRPQGRRIM